MNDMISRHAAIDAHCELCGDRDKCNCDICPDVEVFRLIPSAQPEPQWIPCKTALPEKGQYILCQCRAGIMDVLRLTDDNGWYKDSTHIYMHGFVLAWMPLPEPYREDGEADDKR